MFSGFVVSADWMTSECWLDDDLLDFQNV